MIDHTPVSTIGSPALQAEFDLLADEYRAQHHANVAITGESPAYFAEYKVADLAAFVHRWKLPSHAVLDFGSGIGNSVPYFRQYFAHSEIACADVSARSLEIAQARFPGPEAHVQINDCIALPAASQDLVFSACVFHHIAAKEHAHWLAELLRVTKPGGLLAIYEHNPLNPLTVRAVNTCPLDVNARLIRGGAMCARALEAGWADARLGYKLFFTAFLAGLRPMERHLEWLALGAQCRMTARRPQQLS
jgi:SAM-dependent methyltransferase